MFVLGKNGTTITYASKILCWEEIGTAMRGTGPVPWTATAIKNKKEKVNGTDNRYNFYYIVNLALLSILKQVSNSNLEWFHMYRSAECTIVIH